DLAIDVYLPGDTAASQSPLTTHAGAQQTNYVSTDGNHAGEADLPVATTTQAWFFLARVEVVAPERVGAIVTFGDSITDGTRSTPNTNNRCRISWRSASPRRTRESACSTRGSPATACSVTVRASARWRASTAMCSSSRAC